ncbi:uracil-DNA glycosylase [Sedimenticola selenatireducens]|uniref:Type-5 uracil-DNA glycosylase n=1 Tax=Sedimenticola selenatireducens TaxID=191960 RepID=A0A558DQX6_9GAMM|nr:uracil-DNA glycosylase [Sedimenticola selenatireducens]TVO73475.1 uracil-DNA glycosylase [Sedimenticola selenatireducens]TVT63416.1 MAG: uracil-DNA glycosylase [Sedimenticola selenatireducens]
MFDPACRRCSRLSTFLDQVKSDFPDYFARPVPPFGEDSARLLVVGLAPGMHGANATGRPFTGDYAGILLYETLHRYGFSTKPESLSASDGLRLIDCRITNAVKCLPPQNKPLGSEINTCNQFLTEELKTLPEGGVIIALGLVAHNAVLKAMGLKLSAYKFAHLAQHKMPGKIELLDSYHCSRYNTQTRRLTPEMFQAVFERARSLLNAL